MLMKAGQTFNVAVKRAVEDWAEQKLQSNELKKTISNWGRDGGSGAGQDTERDEELQNAYNTAFDLRCQLRTQKERVDNIQYETQCIINEFEKLGSLDENDEAYRKGVLVLHKVCDSPQRLLPLVTHTVSSRGRSSRSPHLTSSSTGQANPIPDSPANHPAAQKLDSQIKNHEKLFSLIVDDPTSPSLASNYGLLEELRQNWMAKTGAKSDVFSARSGAPSPEGYPSTPGREDNMQMVLQGPRHPQPHASAYPGSSGPNRPRTPAQQGQPGAKPLAASAPQNKNAMTFKTPAPDSRRQPPRNLRIMPNLGSPVGGALVVPSPLESPFEGPNGRPFAPPPQRQEPSFRFPGTPNHVPQAIRPSNTSFNGRGGRGRGSRGTPQPQNLTVSRPPTAFRPQAVEFRPTLPRGMAGPNAMANGARNSNAMQPNNFNSFRGRPKNSSTNGRGPTRGGLQAATIAGSSSRARVGLEGLDSAFLTQVERAIDEFYQLTRGWVTDYAGTPDARQALMVKESPVWAAIVACYPPLAPLEANAYVDIHIMDPFYRPCLISRLIVDFFIARVWNVFAWMGSDDQSDRGLMQLRDDFQRLGKSLLPRFVDLILVLPCSFRTRENTRLTPTQDPSLLSSGSSSSSGSPTS